MNYNQKYNKLFEYLCKINPKFKEIYTSMAESMPEYVKENFKKKGKLFYANTENFQADTNFGECRGLQRRFIRYSTASNKFHIEVGVFTEEDFEQFLQTSKNSSKQIELLEICYAKNANSADRVEGGLKFVLINTDKGLKIIADETVQNKDNINQYDLVGRSIYNVSEQDIKNAFVLEKEVNYAI